MGICAVLLLNGIMGIHPDFGKIKTNKSVRFVHHWTGKLMLVGMSYMCWDGLDKMMDGGLFVTVPLVVVAALGVS